MVAKAAGALFPGSGEDVGGVEPVVEQVDPAVRDVHRTWPDAGGFPVDESRHGPSVPQHVAGVEVAVDERVVVVEDRAVEDLDRLFPHRRLGRPLWQRIRRLRICGEPPHPVGCAGVDVVDVDEYVDELSHPPLARRPLGTTRKLGHQHRRYSRDVAGRVDADQVWCRRCDPFDELKHVCFVRSDRGICGGLLGAHVAAQDQLVMVVCPSRRAGRSACQARPVTAGT